MKCTKYKSDDKIKEDVKQLTLSCIVLLFFSLMFCVSRLSAATLAITSSTTRPLPGQRISLTVEISGLGDVTAPSLGGFDLKLEFEPGVLSYSGHSLGSGLGNQVTDAALTGSTSSEGGLNVWGLSLLTSDQLLTMQMNAFTLATIDMTYTGKRSEAFELVLTSILADENGNPILLESVAPITIKAATPKQMPIPVPTLNKWALLLLGLLMMAVPYRYRAQ